MKVKYRADFKAQYQAGVGDTGGPRSCPSRFYRDAE